MTKSRIIIKKVQPDDKGRITQQAGELTANTHGKAGIHYLFKPLCPFHSYLNSYDDHDASRKHGETYHRSELSPHKDNKHDQYYMKKMKNGERAHLGAYANNFERRGDSYTPDKHPDTKKSVHGSAALYDSQLEYKNSMCEYIAKKVGDKKYIKAGAYHHYPCLMVLIKPDSIYKSSKNKHSPSEAAIEAWSNFLISIYVGYVHFNAKKSGIDIELVRRSGFGFNIPTIAVTGHSIRINVGLIPEVYADILAESLVKLNEILSQINNKEIPKKTLPEKCFYGSGAHKAYLTNNAAKQKYATPALDDIFQLLWQQVEKNGKTTLQNLMRTSFCRDGISAKVFEALDKNSVDYLAPMTAGLEWAINHIRISGNHLSINQNEMIAYPTSKLAAATPLAPCLDPLFWASIRAMTTAIKSNYAHNHDIIRLTDAILAKANNNILNGIYNNLTTLNEFIFLDVLKSLATNPAPSEDGYGSDSEDEESFENRKVYTKKIIVSNGMRAILASLLAIDDGSKSYSLYTDSAYHEVHDAVKLLKDFENHTISISRPATATSANVYLLDVNACVTNGIDSANKLDDFLNKVESKILILDTTSATTQQMYEFVTRFAKSRANAMIFASSGLKNEQNGADKNAYGTIRFFTKDKPLLARHYDHVKKKERPVNSPISHEYRRAVKKIGATPTASAILHSSDKEILDPASGMHQSTP